MSDFSNPYQSPEAQIVPQAKQSSGVELTVNMLKSLDDASPWLRFIGVLGYIGAGISVFTGVAATLGMSNASSTIDLPGELGTLFSTLFLIYIPAGVIMFFPAHFTYKFGQKIRNYKFTNSIEDLEEALKNNKSFWKFTGILCIVSLALVPVSFILMIIVGIAGVLGNLF